MLGNKIKNLRKSNNISQKELAAALNVSRSAVSMWETLAAEPDLETVAKLSAYFGVSVDYILRNDQPQNTATDDTQKLTAKRIPIVGRVPAGIPLEAIEDIIGYEEIPQSWLDGGREYFATKVQGDSMYPKYLEGDIIIVRKQPTCDSGQDCIVYVNGYDATLKKVIILSDGGIQLTPINTMYPPKTYRDGDEPISIAGVVVEIRRKP